MERLRVAVIIGSTRQGRAGAEVARWIADKAAQRDTLEVTTVDLAEFDFPAYYPAQATEPMRDFAKRVDHADAFVVVTPEYNRSFPASLKQAIDYAYDEWHGKPAGVVAYGHRSEGWFAVEQLRTVFTELHVVTMRDFVGINLLEERDHDRQAETLLDQLTWWGNALRHARPYVS